jgi:hypothetical protein
LRQSGGHVSDHHVDLAAQKIVDGERFALVGDVQELDAGHLLQHLARHARRAAAATEADLPGLAFASAMNSATVFAGTFTLTIMICPPLPKTRDRQIVLDRIVGESS